MTGAVSKSDALSPEERQEALMGGLTIRGVLEEAMSTWMMNWAVDIENEEGIEVADDEMVIGESADGGLLVRIGTKTWCISAEEVEP